MSDKAYFASLVARIATDRDRAAFTEVFDHFAPRIKAYLMRLGADAAQAEELTQDVMVTLWRKAALFDASKSSVGTWLFRVARNRRIDLLRRDKSDSLDASDPMLLPSETPRADIVYDAEERDGRVRKAITVLPEEQLTLVRMAFFEGLSHSQISEVTDLPLGTVKSRIRLAFSRLRKALEGDGITEVD